MASTNDFVERLTDNTMDNDTLWSMYLNIKPYYKPQEG